MARCLRCGAGNEWIDGDAPEVKMYRDNVKCRIGHSFVTHRRASSAGKMILTYCPTCECTYLLRAGAVTAAKKP